MKLETNSIILINLTWFPFIGCVDVKMALVSMQGCINFAEIRCLSQAVFVCVFVNRNVSLIVYIRIYCKWDEYDVF